MSVTFPMCTGSRYGVVVVFVLEDNERTQENAQGSF